MRLWHRDLIKYLPKLQLVSQWRENEEVYPRVYGYGVSIFANGRSEDQCRKIACDKMAAYRAMEELF